MKAKKGHLVNSIQVQAIKNADVLPPLKTKLSHTIKNPLQVEVNFRLSHT